MDLHTHINSGAHSIDLYIMLLLLVSQLINKKKD